jgi:hypothetical protein
MKLNQTVSRGATHVAMLLAFVLGGDATIALAAPAATPVPGGAYQTNGVSGTMSQTLFNGTLRLKGMSLKEAVPSDNIRPNGGDEKALVLRGVISNGTKRENHGYFDAALVDADGITVKGRPLDSGWSVEPGAAARFVNGFSVPPGFVPVRLVLIEAATTKGAFRIALKPGDISATTP